MEVTNSMEQIKNSAYTMIVSVMAGLFAYLLLRLLSELSILYFSYDLNIQAMLQLKGIEFLNPSAHTGWTKDTTVTIFLAKPILNMIIGVVTMILYTLIRNKSQSFSFFMVWIIIFSLTNMFGTFAENGLFKTGIYQIIELMHLGSVVLILMVALSLYFLYLSGIGTGKIILLGLSEKQMTSGRINRIYYLMSYILPWLIILGTLFPFSNKNLIISYLFGVILLIPALWAKGPEKEGIHLKPLPPLMWIDWLSVFFYAIGIFLLFTMLSMSIRLH
jgi:hypothetical protein